MANQNKDRVQFRLPGLFDLLANLVRRAHKLLDLGVPPLVVRRFLLVPPPLSLLRGLLGSELLLRLSGAGGSAAHTQHVMCRIEDVPTAFLEKIEQDPRIPKTKRAPPKFGDAAFFTTSELWVASPSVNLT